MRYQDTQFDLSTAVGGGYISFNRFRLNGPYDPDQTGVGCQPYGYDEIAALYNRYQVYGSKCSVQLRITTASSQVFATLLPTLLSSMTNTAPEDLRQVKYARQIVTSKEIQDSQGYPKLSAYCSVKKLYKSRGGSNDNDNMATVSTNPTSNVSWFLYIDTSQAAVDTTVYASVMITYYVKFLQPKDLNES